MTDIEAKAQSQVRSPAERWLEMFFHFFEAPSPERYSRLFHPEGSLLDAGMAEPLPAAQTGAAIAMVLAKLPDLLIRPLRHRIRGDHVFVEARNSGTLNGTALEWGAVYRVHLRNGLVHRGRRFYDQADLFRPLLPATAVLPPFRAAPSGPVLQAEAGPGGGHAGAPEAFLARLEAAWKGGDFAALAALHAAGGRLLAPGLPDAIDRDLIPAWGEYLTGLLAPRDLAVVDWAGDGEVLFVEWRGRGSHAGQEVPFDRIDRFLFDREGRVRESRSYFDTLALLELADPEVARIRARVIKG